MQHWSSRRRFVASVGAVIAAAPLLVRAAEAVNVRVGIAQASSDVGLYLAEKKGYFKAEGLNVTFVPFDSGARMVAPLGAGQLDVGAGSAAAGFYNAVARGIPIKIVADKGSTPPGYGFGGGWSEMTSSG